MFKRRTSINTIKIGGIGLVLSLFIVGLTSTPILADGPPTTNELLNGADMRLFDELPSDIRSILENEFLPALESHGFDEESQADFLAAVVRLEHETRVGPAGSVTGSTTMDLLPGGKCTLTGPYFWHNSSHASTYSSVRCDYQQAALTASSRIVSHGYTPVDVVNHRLHTRSNWSLAIEVYRPGLYNFCGGYTATPEPGRDLAKKPFEWSCVHDRRA